MVIQFLRLCNVMYAVTFSALTCEKSHNKTLKRIINSKCVIGNDCIQQIQRNSTSE